MGLGDHQKIDELQVLWPDGKVQVIKDLKVNQLIQLDYKNATNQNINAQKNIEYFTQLVDLPFNYQQLENVYDDFKDEILLPNKLSTQGPKISKGDVNGDGLDDVYISGAKGMAGKMFVQNHQNSFDETNQKLWQSEKRYEDIHAHFFDSDMDGDMDLYVVSGGNEKNSDLQDRLYLNDGEGNFSKSQNALPRLKQSGSIVQSYDIDEDKDLDLFVGGRVVPGKYPVPANSYILLNENGKFKNVTEDLAPDLLKLGLVTDAIFSDYDKDGDKDLMIVGEWMPLTIFKNDEGRFSKSSLEETTGVGWYYSISENDFDQDGDQDYVLGNLGLNNKFGAKKEKPFHVFCDDFDDSGNLDIVLSKESKGKLLPVRGRECSSQQMPFIKEDFPTFKSFALADLSKIYGQEKLANALHYEATNFASLVLTNESNGNFKSTNLPIEAQMGPLLQTVFHDINQDGHIDIIGGGSIYNAEVETVRYDGSKGFVILNDGLGNFKNYDQSGLSLDGNIKDLCLLSVGNSKQLIAVRNSDSALFFLVK